MIGRIQKWYRKRKYKDDIIINDQSFFVPKMVKTVTLDSVGRVFGSMPHHFIGMSGSIGPIEYVEQEGNTEHIAEYLEAFNSSFRRGTALGIVRVDSEVNE